MQDFTRSSVTQILYVLIQLSPTAIVWTVVSNTKLWKSFSIEIEKSQKSFSSLNMLLNIDITSTVLRLCPHTFSLICIYSNEIISSLHAISTKFSIKSTYKRIISKHYSIQTLFVTKCVDTNVLIKHNSRSFIMKEKHFSLWIETMKD